MAGQRVVNVQFPVAGLDKSAAFQSQPPYTTASASNVRAMSMPDRRASGGRRPALEKAYTTELGSGAPINCMNIVRPLNQLGGTISDTFPGEEYSSNWTTAASYTAIEIGAIGGITSAYGDSTSTVKAIANVAPTDIDNTGAWTIRGTCFIYGHLGRLPASATRTSHEIHVRLDNTAPAPLVSGVKFRMDAYATTGFGPVILAWSIVETLTSTPSNIASGTVTLAAGQTNWQFIITRSTTTNIFSINGSVVDTHTYTDSSSKQRFAIAAKAGTSHDGTTTIYAGFDAVAFDYTTAGSESNVDRLFAASSGTSYRENATGTISTVSTNLSLRSDVNVRSQQRSSILYLADYSTSPLATATNGATNGSPGTTFTSATYSDWAASGVDVDDHVLVITAGTGATVGTYTISSLSGANMVLSTTPGISASGITFTVERSPKKYDSDATTLTAWTATSGKGYVPVGCPLIAMYRDRMVLGGARSAPHIWYMSRIGSPNDWLYSDLDAGRAVAGTSTSAGLIADPLTAIIAFQDDYLVFGCKNQLWVLRGDPTMGGSIGNLSRTIGILSRSAWCWAPTGELVFMSRDGLYMLVPGGGPPVPLSKNRLPDELREIDTANVSIMMQYDVEFDGIHIFTSSASGTPFTHWWYDWSNRGFWPVEIDADHQPLSICNHDLFGSTQRRTLLGCADGYIRVFSDTASDDDGTAVDSHVMLGPFMLGDGAFLEGLITDLRVELGSGGDVTWSLHVGKTVEEALNAAAAASGTFTSGLNKRPASARVRGYAAFLKLSSSTAASPWSLERAAINLKMAGRLK